MAIQVGAAPLRGGRCPTPDPAGRGDAHSAGTLPRTSPGKGRAVPGSG